jgi:hypothetical protein
MSPAMPPILALPLETSLVAYMELLIVLAFAVGWFILEKVANSYDRDKPKPDPEAPDPEAPDPGATGPGRSDPSA